MASEKLYIRSYTVNINRQFWAPRESGGGDIRGNVHLWAIAGSSNGPWPWAWVLDLGSGQGHINIHSTCRTTCRSNHVTVALRSTEIWPFEFRQISILDEVWTLMIAFLDGNSKIGLRQAVNQVPYYGHQPSVLSSMRKWRRRYTWKCTFMGNCRKFKWSVTLSLTLDRVKVTSTYTVHVGLPACSTTWL